MMRRVSLFGSIHYVVLLFLVNIVCAAPADKAPEQEWTRFRGPNGTGISSTRGLPTKWTDSDYLWTATLPGIGHSSPVIWDELVFLTAADNKSAERILLCLDARDGKLKWERRYPSTVHKKHEKSSFASSTPTVDKDHVYVCWSSPEEYIVVALSHSGSEVWRVDLGPVVAEHSTGTSPIVYDGMVILSNDQDGEEKASTPGVSSYVALDCKDGHQRWRTPRRNAVVSYSTPCVYQPKGKPAELIFNSQAHGISGVDPRTGHVNWELAVLDKRSVSSPVFSEGLIFGTVGSGGGGSYVAAVTAGPNPTLAYKLKEQAPYVPSLLTIDGLLFLWSDKGIVSCYEAAKGGEPLWRERVGGNFFASPICIDRALYNVAENGEVVVVAAAPKFQLLGRSMLGEGSESTPAVAGGRLYLRSYSHLYVLGEAKVKKSD